MEEFDPQLFIGNTSWAVNISIENTKLSYKALDESCKELSYCQWVVYYARVSSLFLRKLSYLGGGPLVCPAPADRLKIKNSTKFGVV